MDGAASADGVSVEAITPNLGAIVHGVDAKFEQSDATVERLSALLLQYKVLFFRNQGLSRDQHRRFARYFGVPRESEFAHKIPDHPGLFVMDPVTFFHSDVMQMEVPPKFAMLHMNTAPQFGGDTIWVDLVTSYADLSEPLRNMLEQLTGWYSFSRYEGDGSNIAMERVKRHGADFETVLKEVQPHMHPIVRVIEETGQKNYWICKAFTQRINELTREESDVLLTYLFSHQLQPQYSVRWKWQDGDIALWDQRTTLHSGVGDYGDQTRDGQRAAIDTEVPVPAWATVS